MVRKFLVLFLLFFSFAIVFGADSIELVKQRLQLARDRIEREKKQFNQLSSIFLEKAKALPANDPEKRTANQILGQIDRRKGELNREWGNLQHLIIKIETYQKYQGFNQEALSKARDEAQKKLDAVYGAFKTLSEKITDSETRLTDPEQRETVVRNVFEELQPVLGNDDRFNDFLQRFLRDKMKPVPSFRKFLSGINDELKGEENALAKMIKVTNFDAKQAVRGDIYFSMIRNRSEYPITVKTFFEKGPVEIGGELFRDVPILR